MTHSAGLYLQCCEPLVSLSPLRGGLAERLVHETRCCTPLRVERVPRDGALSPRGSAAAGRRRGRTDRHRRDRRDEENQKIIDVPPCTGDVSAFPESGFVTSREVEGSVCFVLC